MRIIHIVDGFVTNPYLTYKAQLAFDDKMEKTIRAKFNSQSFTRYLKANAYPERARSLQICAQTVHFDKDESTGYLRMFVPNPCGMWRLCQICAIRRQGMFLKKLKPAVMERVQNGFRQSFITLTIQSMTDLKEMFDTIMSAVRAMFAHRRASLSNASRNAPIEFTKLNGAIVCVEVKRGRDKTKWHVHIHLIGDHDAGTTIHKNKLGKEWERFTKGAGKIVHVRPITNDANSIKECIKYPIKIDDMKHADILHAWQTLAGRRMLNKFGCYRSVVIPDSEPPAVDGVLITDDLENWDVDLPASDELLSSDEINDKEIHLEFRWDGGDYILCYRFTDGEGWRVNPPTNPNSSHEAVYAWQLAGSPGGR